MHGFDTVPEKFLRAPYVEHVCRDKLKCPAKEEEIPMEKQTCSLLMKNWCCGSSEEPCCLRLINSHVNMSNYKNGFYEGGPRYDRATEVAEKIKKGLVLGDKEVFHKKYNTRSYRLKSTSGSVIGRMYEPNNLASRERVPIMLYMHGGGFVMGEHDDMSFAGDIALRLSSEFQCYTISLNYRKAPEDPFPAGITDCFSAMEWLANDESNKVLPSNSDKKKLSLIGDSSGANFAAVLTSLWRDSLRADLTPLSREVQQKLTVKFVILLYPCCMPNFPLKSHVAPEMKNATLLPHTLARYFINAYTQYNNDLLQDRRINLFRIPYSGFPKTILISAGRDPLKDDAFILSDLLKEANVDYLHKHYPKDVHGFLYLGILLGSMVTKSVKDIFDKVPKEFQKVMNDPEETTKDIDNLEVQPALDESE